MKILFLFYHITPLVFMDVYVLFFQIHIIKLIEEISTSLYTHFVFFHSI